MFGLGNNMLAEISFNNLLDFKKVADEIGLRFMLMEGTLLGAYRDKGFVINDETDIDLGIMEEEFDKVPELINRLLNIGFNFPKVVNFNDVFHGGDLNRNGCHIDLMRMIRQDNLVYNIGEMGALRYDFPKEVFDGYSKIMFYGHEFDAPKDIELCLETRYGDWGTPVGAVGHPGAADH